ncbi:fungal specific transcription factor domain-containing protein [Apiospora rasikravindrae]|uniref:Fungal specific transcription factor domain-containing protein n=1 Tax=Apiospora rasikravindrae TaxID=990691 RepID=A0ABR1SM09_9PEZI
MPPSSQHSQTLASVPESPIKGENADVPDLDLSDVEDLSDAQSADESSAPSQQKGKGVDNGDAPSAPLQKRRRVTRACDECRRKKIKCDGKQPCTHCQVYSYECTYDKPSNRRRNPAPQYIEALESKLQRAEMLLRKFMPDVDLNDPSLDPSVQQEFRMRDKARTQRQRLVLDDTSSSSSSMLSGQLMSMIPTLGSLDLNDKGDYDFHGVSSGAAPLHARGRRSGNILGLDSPRSSMSSRWDMPTTSTNIYDMPPLEVARTLCNYSLNYATCLLRIVHIPSFLAMLESLYAKPTHEYDREDNKNLALAYSVMALGCMYNVPDGKDSKGKPSPYELAIEQGLKYYTSARILLNDPTECRDLASLQALLFQIFFIQSMSNLSTCYGFVGIALRSALRMGLHRNLSNRKFDPIETESRRRVFYVCRQLDIYVSALLGFPMLLNDDDVDQLLPTAVNDEFITKDGILPVPPGTPSFFEAFNAHARLMDILSQIIRQVYPLKGTDSVEDGTQSSASYMIKYSKIKEMEKKLQEWYEELPVAWRPNSSGTEEVLRVRNLLRFAYAHVQMVLYRPFLHYVSPRISAGKKVDDRAYACGAAGISVARNIMQIGTEMRKQVSLVGPYWFTFFTEFFAIISLVFFILENKEKPGVVDLMADASAGREMISKLAPKSMAADRISNALNILFDGLPDDLKKVRVKPSAPSKKRSAPGVKGGAIATPSPPVLHTRTHRRKDDTSRSRSGSAKPVRSSVGPGSSHVFPDVMGQSHHNMHHGTPGGDMNSLSRLGGMVFPPEDPLAYPHQTRPDFGFQQHMSPSLNPVVSHAPDPSQYFTTTGPYDGIEGQLMGPLPPYLMQTQSQSMFDFPTQMYSDPMFVPMQPSRPPPQAPPTQRLSSLQQRQLAAQNRQHDTTLETFANTPWSGIFPHLD